VERALLPALLPSRECSQNILAADRFNLPYCKLQFVLADLRLGGRCQWVLDAACQAVEWFHQPLGFDSLTLLVESLDLHEAA
jgi:hypothetical protein